jgi:hypothetical protein
VWWPKPSLRVGRGYTCAGHSGGRDGARPSKLVSGSLRSITFAIATRYRLSVSAFTAQCSPHAACDPNPVHPVHPCQLGWRASAIPWRRALCPEGRSKGEKERGERRGARGDGRNRTDRTDPSYPTDRSDRPIRPIDPTDPSDPWGRGQHCRGGRGPDGAGPSWRDDRRLSYRSLVRRRMSSVADLTGDGKRGCREITKEGRSAGGEPRPTGTARRCNPHAPARPARK